MKTNLSEQEKKDIREAQAEARKIFENKKLFDEELERIFKTYDKNKDNCIDLDEYIPFLQDMIASMGRQKYSIPNIIMNFERSDKDKNGQIDKAEFKKEFTKRVKEFLEVKV